jgi:hypothetical protein
MEPPGTEIGLGKNASVGLSGTFTLFGAGKCLLHRVGWIIGEIDWRRFAVVELPAVI